MSPAEQQKLSKYQSVLNGRIRKTAIQKLCLYKEPDIRARTEQYFCVLQTEGAQYRIGVQQQQLDT